MYIKAWRNKKEFTGNAKPHCGRGRECPCFAVCALVCDLSPKAECVPAFWSEGKRGPFVGEVENWDEKRLGIKFMAAVSPDFSHLLVLRVHREPGNICI